MSLHVCHLYTHPPIIVIELIQEKFSLAVCVARPAQVYGGVVHFLTMKFISVLLAQGLVFVQVVSTTVC